VGIGNRTRGLVLALAGAWLLHAPTSASVRSAVASGMHPWALEGQMVFLRMAPLETAGVIAVAQDRQGFLWFGTQSNLLRWDGYHLRAYAQNPEVPGSLPDNYIRSLYMDEQDRLWVGSNAGGLSRYDAQTDTFISYPVGPGGTRDGNISALASDGAGGIWIGTRQGLEHYNGKTQKMDPPDEQVPPMSILSLLLDHEGNLWIGTRSGLTRRLHGANEFFPYALPTPEGPAPEVIALREDRAGRVWIGTMLYGAYLQEPGSDHARPLRDPGTTRPVTESVVTICDVGDGEVWLGTGETGILRVDTATGRIRQELRDLARSWSLPSNQIDSIFLDHTGLLWVGTRAGLSRLDPRQRLIQTFNGGSDPNLLVGDEAISALMSLPDGRVWVALGSGGVDIIDPVEGRVGRIRPDPEHMDRALPRSQVNSMARLPDGSLFLGTATGLYRASPDGSHVERLAVPGHKLAFDVRSLAASEGHLWLGSYDGLFELSVLPGGSLTLLGQWSHELSDPRVRSLLPGKDGDMWIGSPTGVDRLEVATNRVTRMRNQATDPSALPGGYVSSLLIDRKGRLWVSTFGRGIQVEQGRSADGQLRFRRLTQRDGLPQNSVDALVQDLAGNIWASTDGGLARIAPDTLEIRSFRAAQGVGVDGFFTGVAAVSPAGDLWFGGLNGVVVVHPDRIVTTNANPAMVISDVHVGNRSLAAAQVLSSQGLQVQAGDRGFTIEFATLDFADPELRRYAYRLAGFDTDWLETPASRRLAAYTNLPPGDYTLQLRSASADGPWTTPLEVAVHVLPAWYQHAVVRGFAVFLVLALIAGLVQMRLVVLHRRQRDLKTRQVELEKLVTERTAELRRSQEYLEKMAYFDTLTGLPNRRMFNDQLRRTVASHVRGQVDFALLLIDLDGFKTVNDTFGHDAGDALLMAIGEHLTGSIRETDLAARLGGDEFGVLLSQPGSREEIEATCQRIIRKLGEPLYVAGKVVRVGASAGIVTGTDDGATPDELYKAADTALYEAKKAGRNTFRWGRVEARTVIKNA